MQVQVVTTSDDGQESIRELACIEREDLTAESLGLSVAESKALLQSLQEVVVEWQMKTYLDSQRHYPDTTAPTTRSGRFERVINTKRVIAHE
jgi:hypothetical protein